MLCNHCGTKFGKVMIKKMTFVEGECDCCHNVTNVTEDRIFGFPNYHDLRSPEEQQILERSLDFRTLADGRRKMDTGEVIDLPDYKYFSEFPG